MEIEDDVPIDATELAKVEYVLPVKRVHPSCASVTERYYQPRYFVPSAEQIEKKNVGDQLILWHSNRICLISLSPEHPVLKQKKAITAIDFVGPHEESNRLNNKVSGKFKKGGQKLKETSILCVIKCADGSSHSVVSSMRGSLIEVNERLVREPQLLVDQPWSDGYIALAIAGLQASADLKERMITHADYVQLVAERERSRQETLGSEATQLT